LSQNDEQRSGFNRNFPEMDNLVFPIQRKIKGIQHAVEASAFHHETKGSRLKHLPVRLPSLISRTPYLCDWFYRIQSRMKRIQHLVTEWDTHL
jgi:hypothetical protein